MKNKIAKKCLIILTLLMILFAIYNIVKIYAVFQSESNGNMSTKVSNWTIYVNDTLISKSNQAESFTINDLNVDNNEHIRPGKIAPGLAGNFNITINPDKTDVSIRYDIKIDKENLTNKNLQITSIKEINENNDLIETAEDVYTGIIPLSKIQQGITNSIQAKVEWNDDGSSDNEDTITGTKTNPKITIPITVNVSQYTGEEIVPINNN